MGEIIEMRRNEVLSFAGYSEFEQAADKTAIKIKEGFMEMGYILKVARDTDILRDSGYSNYEEFAEKRYDLDKGTVSRYIRIVERFSVDGCSHVLKDSYKGVGFAKLSLMLHLSDEVAAELMDKYSKQEVLAIKEEIEEEMKISEIELVIEQAEQPREEREDNLLTRVVRQLGKEQQELYRKLWHLNHHGNATCQRMLDLLAPQGDAIHFVRIPGTGRLMLSVSGKAVSITNVRTNEKEQFSDEELFAAMPVIFHGESPEESYLQEYGEAMEVKHEEPKTEEKAKVAPVQPKEKRKESKVTKSKPQKPKKEPTAAVVEEPKTEEQLPGQTSIEDHPEYMPESTYEEITEEKDNIDAEETEETAVGDIFTADAGEDTDSGEGTCTGELAEDEIQEPDESTGASESGGCENNSCGVDEEEIWMECRAHQQELGKYFAIWNQQNVSDIQLEAMYKKALALAAGLEKIRIAKAQNV